AATGTERFLLDGHKDAVRAVAFSPDGKKLASGDEAGKVILRDVAANSKPLVLGEHKGAVVGVAFGPDRKAPGGAGLLASAGADGTLKVWDLGTGQGFPLSAKGRLFSCMAFSPDGKLLATGDQVNAVILWDVEKRRELAPCSGHEAIVAGVAFGRDGKLLASAGWDGTVRLWDLSGTPSSGSFPCTAVLRGHAGRVHAVSFDASGERLASASDDTTVKVW